MQRDEGWSWYGRFRIPIWNVGDGWGKGVVGCITCMHSAASTRHLRAVLRDARYSASSPRMHVDLALDAVRNSGEDAAVWHSFGAPFTRRRTALDSFLRYVYAAVRREGEDAAADAAAIG